MHTKVRRATTLAASLVVLLIGASFYAQNVRTEQHSQQALASAVESVASRR